MALQFTPAMWMLVDLMISNAIKAAMREAEKVVQMTPDEVAAETLKQEKRKQDLTAELYE
jgi:hypothetical protein